MFLKSNEVQESLKNEEKYDILKSSISKKSYTVLLPKTFPVITYEKPLEWRYLDEVPVCEL